MAAFIEHEAMVKSSATLRRRQASIRKVHQLLRLPNPAVNQDVVIAMRRALRGKSRRHKQALGLTTKLRDQLINAADPKTLIGLRNIALLRVGYDTLCRRSELAALCWEDLTPLDDKRDVNPDPARKERPLWRWSIGFAVTRDSPISPGVDRGCRNHEGLDFQAGAKNGNWRSAVAPLFDQSNS